jgi:catechol 2,3-dioxygenase-like lactoylglutathione lyase family enzyme
MELRPMLQVRDVEAASRWYQAVLGLRSGHGGPDYEMLFDGDRFVLQLHRLEAHEHGGLGLAGGTPAGAGVSLWFEAADRDELAAAVTRAMDAGTPVVEPVHHNPIAHHHEATVLDVDGYAVIVHSPFEP